MACLDHYIDKALQLHSVGGLSLAQTQLWRPTQKPPLFRQAAKWIAGFLNTKLDHGLGGAERWRGRLGRNSNLLQKIQTLDESVLRSLNRNGFLTHTPKVGYVWAEHDDHTAGQNLPYSDGWGEIKMFIKNSGRLGAAPASNSVAHQMNKWLVLFHEASHNEFYTSLNIFVPHEFFNTKDVQMINDWGMNRLFCSRASLLLSEAFADCYGSMMLLEGFGHSEESQAAVHNLIGLRRADAEGKTPTVIYSLCPTVLQTMWNNRQDWMGKTPTEIKKIARIYSSNALVLMGAEEPNKTDNVLYGLIEDKMRIQPFMFEFCLEHLRHTSKVFLTHMDKTYARIPMWPHMRRLCERLAADFDQSPLQKPAADLFHILQSNKNLDPHILFTHVQKPLSQYLRTCLIELSSCPEFNRDWIEYTRAKEHIVQHIEQRTIVVKPTDMQDQLKIRRQPPVSNVISPQKDFLVAKKI